MHTRGFHVLHESADFHFLAVTYRINVHFNGVVQEVIQKHRAVFAHHNGFVHVAHQFLTVMHDIHGAAAQNVARTHHDRVADFFGKFQSRFFGVRRAVGRLTKAQFIDELLEAFTVFGAVNRIR